MFATKPKLFAIGTIAIPTSVWLDQLVKLITLTSLNIVEHVDVLVELVFVLHVLSNINVELISVLLVKITISLDIFKQHLIETFFHLK
jgi:hypothetical protein